MNITTTMKSVLLAGAMSLNIVAQVNAQEWALTAQTYVGFDIQSMGFSIVCMCFLFTLNPLSPIFIHQ